MLALYRYTPSLLIVVETVRHHMVLSTAMVLTSDRVLRVILRRLVEIRRHVC